MELVGGGSDINGATPSSFSVSVLLLASVMRFGVSRMRDFLLIIGLAIRLKKLNIHISF